MVKPSAQKAQEAIDWLADFIGYHSDHEKFLPEVVAQINVRVGNIIEDCELDRDDLLDLSTDSEEPIGKINPSVVSLYN